MKSLTFTSETESDRADLRILLTEAFGRSGEADLVDVIRRSQNFIPELSLVAKVAGEAIAYLLFSYLSVETPDQTSAALALAPLAVRPRYQQQGIGTQLVKVGLDRCRELGHPLAIVVGEPHFYQRFGFQKASQFGLTSSLPIPDEVFMVLELTPNSLQTISGRVCYPDYFVGV